LQFEVEEFGVREVRDLKENGSKIAVTNETKDDYVKRVCQTKMTGEYCVLDVEVE